VRSRRPARSEPVPPLHPSHAQSPPDHAAAEGDLDPWLRVGAQECGPEAGPASRRFVKDDGEDSARYGKGRSLKVAEYFNNAGVRLLPELLAARRRKVPSRCLTSRSVGAWWQSL
jgi:hypothetical protein